MVEEKYCDLTHSNLGDDIKEMKQIDRDHEIRIVTLEKVSHARDEQIKNILDGISRNNKSIDNLVSWIKWGLAFLIPLYIKMIGELFSL